MAGAAIHLQAASGKQLLDFGFYRFMDKAATLSVYCFHVEHPKTIICLLRLRQYWVARVKL
jgi:hypothetical protein